jgi:hypothetical protein
MSVVKPMARHRASAAVPLDHRSARAVGRPQHRGGLVPMSMLTGIVGAAAVLLALAVVVVGVLSR